jgi:hypothetical protein
MIPREAVETDHELEQMAEIASGELAKHRWHWTLDETNPDRVSIREYARDVGRAYSTVYAYANSYKPDRSGPISEDLKRANMGAETQAATEAVAKARGQSFKYAKDKQPSEVRRVRETARQLAEERGTSVEEEAPKVAETIVRTEKAEKATQAERAERSDMRFFEMERYLISAKRELMRAVKLAPEVPWDDEHRDLLSMTIGNVKALPGLLDSAISGISSTDWDAEFSKISDQP